MMKYTIKSFAFLVVLAIILSSVPQGAFTALALPDDSHTEIPMDTTTQEPSPSPTIEPTPSPSATIAPDVISVPEPTPMATEQQDSKWKTTSDNIRYNDVAGIEDTSKRDLHTKVYQLENGSAEVVLFAQPIHYLDDGKYYDIDNSLEYVSERMGGIYKNKANNFSVEIASSIDSDWNVTISKGPYTLQWKINGLIAQKDGIRKSHLSKEQWQLQSEGQKGIQFQTYLPK